MRSREWGVRIYVWTRGQTDKQQVNIMPRVTAVASVEMRKKTKALHKAINILTELFSHNVTEKYSQPK